MTSGWQPSWLSLWSRANSWQFPISAIDSWTRRSSRRPSRSCSAEPSYFWLASSSAVLRKQGNRGLSPNERMAFLLGHLSDPHLAPLPQPRLVDLLGKRAIGYVNWRRRRHLVHRIDILARIVEHLQAFAP